MQIDEGELLVCNSIEIDGVGELYQPLVKDIAAMGYDKYFDFMIVFAIDQNILSEKYKEIDMYDFFFLPENEAILRQLLLAFAILFKEDIKLDIQNGDFCFLVGKNGVINRNNFEDIREIIRKINCTPMLEPEKIPTNMTEEQRKIHEKLKKHRKRHIKDYTISFKERINTVAHCGNSFISYDVIGNFTYYQFINSYEVITGLKYYGEYMGYKLSFKYDIKEELPHWSKVIKNI